MTTKQTALGSCIAAFLLTLLLYIPDFAVAQETKPSINVQLTIDSPKLVQNEIFTLTLTVESSGVNLGNSYDLRALPGEDIIKRLTPFSELASKKETRNFQTIDIRYFSCKAQAVSSKPVVAMPILRVGILSRQRTFFGYRNIETRRDIKIKPLTINISPLPTEGRPHNFSGAVGQFNFDVQLTPKDVAVGDLVTAHMRINGSGYMENISPPRISSGQHFKVYSPTALQTGKSNQRAFDQVLIPQSTNAATIPAISFSYYDPKTDIYKSVSKGPFVLTFHPQRSTETIAPFKPKETNSISGQPINVASNGDSKNKGLSFAERTFSKKLDMTVTESERAKFAPAHSAITLFELKEGDLVRESERFNGWSKIHHQNNMGWIPTKTLKPVMN